MKQAKLDYYDPKLKGHADGKGMENLPPIVTPPPRKGSSKSAAIDRAAIATPDQVSPDLAKSALLQQSPDLSTDPPTGQAASRPADQPIGQAVSRPVDQREGQSASQRVSQSTNQSTDRSTARSIDRSTILGRPKSFYITEKQDRDLDVAVQKLMAKVKGKVNQKIDRSTLVRLLLEVSQVTADELIERLASQLIRRLVSQLTS